MEGVAAATIFSLEAEVFSVPLCFLTGDGLIRSRVAVVRRFKKSLGDDVLMRRAIGDRRPGVIGLSDGKDLGLVMVRKRACVAILIWLGLGVPDMLIPFCIGLLFLFCSLNLRS